MASFLINKISGLRTLAAAGLILGIISLLGFSISSKETAIDPKASLSEYQFFSGKMADLIPGTGVFPYEVNAPLFTDYAEKQRLIYLPPGAAMTYDSAAAFGFPTGSAIIKNFMYPVESGHPEKGRRILETRLLLKDDTGWKALTYIWNDAQTDAFLEVAGASIPVEWVAADGKKHKITYAVPNQNQCKGCHSYDGLFVPIGVTARQVNRVEGEKNQLTTWAKSGRLLVPEDFTMEGAPVLFDYRTIQNAEKEAPQKVALAARAYLDGNCAHCHNPHGPASTSGMFLEATQKDQKRLGIGKPPVAAGRGSGDRKFGIVRGKPGESILFYRMESDDPGIRMPELGRQLAHKEGLDIIKAWIKNM